MIQPLTPSLLETGYRYDMPVLWQRQYCQSDAAGAGCLAELLSG